MAGERILVVEDESDIQELIRYNLEREGYRIAGTDSGEKALAMARKQMPDLVVLDLMLPDLDGLSVCRQLKADPSLRTVPVLMLTAKSEDADIVTGLEMGADDYVTKPFSPRVLLARIRAIVRRNTPECDGGPMLKRGAVVIDRLKHRVSVAGKGVELTITEFRILELLADHPGVVFDRYKIVDRVHGEDYPVTDRSIDVQIVGLRKKLGKHSACIETVRGVGYRFMED
jgi:two-component system, OmpR family, alkaline phosphatase synthesis response regulator PhoP